MTVVIITDFAFINGGSGKVAIQSAIGLAKRGFDVHLIAAYGPLEKELADEPRVKVTIVETGTYNKALGIKDIPGYIWNNDSADAVGKVLDQLSPANTVVHIHSFKDCHSPSVCNVAKSKKFKVAFTAHDYTMLCPYVGLFNLKEKEICKIKPMSWECITTNCQETNLFRKQINVARFAALTKIVKYPEGLDYLICVGKHSRDAMQKYLKGPVPSSVVYYPIDVTEEPRIEAEKNQVFGFTGRLSVEKDPVTAALAAKIANIPIRFVGGGPMEAEIRAANKDAEITGWVSGAEVKEHMKQLRVNLLPSIWLEGLPLGIQESTGMGIPCIVCEVCGSSETVADYKCGLTHKPKDPEDLARCMTLLKDDATLEGYSRDGYANYWDNPPTAERHLDGIEAVYRELLGAAK